MRNFATFILCITLLVVVVIGCRGCWHGENSFSNKAAQSKDTVVVTIHDTIRDTIRITDEGLVETINYYKLQTSLLWKAINLMEVTNQHNAALLSDINYQIVSSRDKHNQQVTRELFNDLSKIKK